VVIGSGGAQPADITAVAWPNSDALDALDASAGDVPVNLRPVPLIGTSAGRYVATLSALPASYVEPDGTVSLELRAETSTQTAFANVVASASGAAIMPQAGGATLFNDAMALALRPTCNTRKTSNHQTPVEGYVQANGSIYAPAHVYERTQTTHELGISVSVDGGPYKASGSASSKVTTGSSDTTPNRSTSDLWKNKVNYYQFVTSCQGHVTRRWKPTSIYGLNVDFDVVSHPVYSHCYNKVAGQTWTRDRGTTHSYGKGVELAPVKVSAGAEWGSDMSVAFNANATVKYCGTSADGPEQSPLVEVHHA
jgi:hypothetical protein